MLFTPFNTKYFYNFFKKILEIIRLLPVVQ